MIKLCAFSDEAGNDLITQIKALQRNEIFLMELRSINKINISEFDKEYSKETSKILQNEGIEVFSLGSPLGKENINLNFEKYKDKVKKVCETACIFNCKNIRAFSFYNSNNCSEKVFEYMNEMSEIAKSYKVNLCHENEKDIYGESVKNVLEIMQNVNGWEYVFDPANFVQVGENIDNAIEKLFDKIKYFHIKDSENKNLCIVPAGYGDGKIEKIVNNINRETVLSVEPHLHEFDAFSKIDKTELKNIFKFSSLSESFDFACDSIKKILEKCGYKKNNKNYIK